jgi:hypothetical protein
MDRTQEQRPEKDGERESRAERARAPSAWEWGITAVSALLVVVAIGFVFYQAVAGRPLPPKIVVEVGEIVESEPGYGCVNLRG